MSVFEFFDSGVARRSLSDLLEGVDSQLSRRLIKAFLIIFCSSALLSAAPLLMARAINSLSENSPLSTTLTCASLYIGLRFSGQMLVDLRWKLVNPILYQISYTFCSIFASRISRIPRHEGRNGDSAGWIAEQAAAMSKLEVGSIGILHGFLSVIIPTSIELLIACIAIGIVIGPLVAAYMIVGGIIFMIGISFKRNKELSLARIANQADNTASSFLSEYISNPTLARVFNAAPFLEDRLSAAVANSVESHQKFFSVKTERGLYLSAITLFIYTIVLSWGIYNPSGTAATAGSFFLLLIYLDRVLNPLSNASTAINNIQNGLIAIEAGYELIEKLKKEKLNVTFSPERSKNWSSLSLSKSRVYHVSNEHLTIGAGVWINVRGPSGTGKSTYLQRIYGELQELAGASVTRIHYLNPTPPTIRGSIFDNIALGDKSVDREKVKFHWNIWAREIGNSAINIDEDVEQLSAGELQFLAISRCILRNPFLVFFDEATNSMDVRTEEKVWLLIKTTIPGATVFAVSHRNLSVIDFDFLDDFSFP